MEFEDVRYDVNEGIATVTIDRQEAYNAFTRQTILELNERIRQVRADEAVYVVILTGAGDAFCAGADTTAMGGWDDMTIEEYGGYLWAVQNVVRQLRALSKPSIAAVGGPAIGAGCDFALACDLRTVDPDTLMREGFVRVGLVPGDGGGWLLPRLVGESTARKFLLTGRDIDAETAMEIGLAAERGPDALVTATELAEELLALPATAVRRTNDLIDAEQGFEAYCERAIAYQWECIEDPEHAEAIAAFNESRDPVYDRPY